MVFKVLANKHPEHDVFLNLHGSATSTFLGRRLVPLIRHNYLVEQCLCEGQVIDVEDVQEELRILVILIILFPQLIAEANELVEVRCQLIHHTHDIVLHQVLLVDNLRLLLILNLVNLVFYTNHDFHEGNVIFLLLSFGHAAILVDNELSQV